MQVLKFKVFSHFHKNILITLQSRSFLGNFFFFLSMSYTFFYPFLTKVQS